jgi:Uma2 family endonuclease
MNSIFIKTQAFQFTDEEFFLFCSDNKDLRFERDKDQNIIVITPTGSETSKYNSDINFQLVFWNKKKETGYIFDSNAGFILPNKAMRSPDAAWISKEKYENLTDEDRKWFPHICPEFIIELKSPSDTLNALKEKMLEWVENGIYLGWLIDPDTKTVLIYRQDGTIARQDFSKPISGEQVLPGFELDLSFIK